MPDRHGLRRQGAVPKLGPMQQDGSFPSPSDSAGANWRVRIVVAILILLAVSVVGVTNRWLTERFTETTRNRAELRLALYSGNMMSELQRTSVVPLLLARDPELIRALNDQQLLGLLGNAFYITTILAPAIQTRFEL